MEITDIDKLISKHQRNKELWIKVNEMMKHVVSQAVLDLNDVKYKYTDTEQLGENAIKQTLVELGFSYIVDIMDTITGFEFNTMLAFAQYIGQLKGTRKGLELVLKLMGFDSVIKEWWEDRNNLGEPWSYEIIVIVDSSYVPDIFNTLDKVRIFSEHYVLAKISNIDVRFSSEQFAERSPVMAGFVHSHYSGIVVQRA